MTQRSSCFKDAIEDPSLRIRCRKGHLITRTSVVMRQGIYNGEKRIYYLCKKCRAARDSEKYRTNPHIRSRVSRYNRMVKITRQLTQALDAYYEYAQRMD